MCIRDRGDELDAIVQSIIRGTEFKEAGKRTLQKMCIRDRTWDMA